MKKSELRLIVIKLKSVSIPQFIDELVYDFQLNKDSNVDKSEFIKASWGKLEEFLKTHNLPNEIFLDLNNRYRKTI